MKYNNLAQAFLEVEEFSERIKKKYGVTVGMYVKEKVDKHVISLAELRTLVEKSILEQCPEESGSLFKTRRKPTIDYQHSFCLIAWEFLGYPKTNIARYLGRNHATVINSINKAQGWLDINDAEFTYVHNNVLEKVNKYVGNVPENTEERNDTKPVSAVI